MKYSDFLIQAKQIEEHYSILAENEVLKRENEKLRRENYGLKTTIKNLKEKLYKRNDNYRGGVERKERGSNVKN